MTGAAWRRALLAEKLRRIKAAHEDFIPHAPTERQKEFLALDCLEALYGGAAGGGKSDALLMAALQYVREPDYNAILFRRTYADLALPEALMERAHEWLDPTSAKWSGETHSWLFPSGATLSFGYMDGPRDHMRYKSAAFQYIGFDELTEFHERQYLYLFSRLRRGANTRVPLRMRAATNPGDIGHRWVKRRFIDAHEGADCAFVPATLSDNPYIDQGAYEASLQKLDPVTYAQLSKGQWIQDAAGLVYRFDDEQNRAKCLPDLARDETWTYVLGIDYGNVNATALVLSAFAEHRPELYVLRSYAASDLTPSEAAELVDRWNRAFPIAKIVGDLGGLGKGYAEEARRRYYLPIEPAEKTNKGGHQKLLNGDLSRGLVKILPGNEALIDQLTSHLWRDEHQSAESKVTPHDLCDALLYSWRSARHYSWSERERPVIDDPLERREIEAYREERENDQDWELIAGTNW